METSEQVAKILYEFVQLMGKTTVTSDAKSDEWLVERLTQGSISIKEAINLPPTKKTALSELLKQYIVFLTVCSHLTFPQGFTSGSSETLLGDSLVEYMLENREVTSL